MSKILPQTDLTKMRPPGSNPCKIRLCAGCRALFPRQTMIRIMAVRAKGPIVKHPTHPSVCWFAPGESSGNYQGRSAYLCPHQDCLAIAIKRKSLNRSLKCTLPSDMLEKLSEYFRDMVH